MHADKTSAVDRAEDHANPAQLDAEGRAFKALFPAYQDITATDRGQDLLQALRHITGELFYSRPGFILQVLSYGRDPEREIAELRGATGSWAPVFLGALEGSPVRTPSVIMPVQLEGQAQVGYLILPAFPPSRTAGWAFDPVSRSMWALRSRRLPYEPLRVPQHASAKEPLEWRLVPHPGEALPGSRTGYVIGTGQAKQSPVTWLGHLNGRPVGVTIYERGSQRGELVEIFPGPTCQPTGIVRDDVPEPPYMLPGGSSARKWARQILDLFAGMWP